MTEAAAWVLVALAGVLVGAAVPVLLQLRRTLKAAEATLESIAGRRLTFRVSVKHREDLVAAGRVTRAVVDRARFLAKVTGTG